MLNWQALIISNLFSIIFKNWRPEDFNVYGRSYTALWFWYKTDISTKVFFCFCNPGLFAVFIFLLHNIDSKVPVHLLENMAFIVLLQIDWEQFIKFTPKRSIFMLATTKVKFCKIDYQNLQNRRYMYLSITWQKTIFLSKSKMVLYIFLQHIYAWNQRIEFQSRQKKSTSFSWLKTYSNFSRNQLIYFIASNSEKV